MCNDKQFLPNSTSCFVCGEENDLGLRARLYEKDGRVMMPLNADPRHCGFPNVVHGGVTAAAMDECMSWAAIRALNRMCLTGDLNIRYLRPVPQDKALTVWAEITRSHRRMAHAKSAVVDAEGVEYVVAEGRFLPMSVEETLAVDDFLIYRDGMEPLFDDLRNTTEP